MAIKKLLAIVLTIAVTAVLAHVAISDVYTAQYKTATVCMMCHKTTHKAIVEGYMKSPHAKSMRKATDEGAIVGDFTTNKAFKKEQVAFVLGSGRQEQAYLDAAYKVLPASWDVASKTWKPALAVDGTTQCIGCHTTGYDAVKKTSAQIGVGCEACHGPGGDHVPAPKKMPMINPKDLNPQQQAMVCGQCHSVGKDKSTKCAFPTGISPEPDPKADPNAAPVPPVPPTGYRPGDDLTKFFTDAKPQTAGRNQQYSEYITSKHAQNGVTCITCHDPHNTGTNADQLKKPINELCLGCHAAKVKDIATHAPTAPEGATCATCHMPKGRHIFAKPEEAK